MLSKVKSAVIFTASVIAVLYVAYRIPGLGPIVFQSAPAREVGRCGAVALICETEQVSIRARP